MPKENVKLTELKTWTSDYAANRQHIGETMNVVFKLADLNELINYIDEENKAGAAINAVRFYLVRQNEINGESSGRAPVFIDCDRKPQSQISLVAVPVDNYEYNTDRNNKTGGKGEDHMNGDNVTCIYPSGNHEHTGLCPHSCGQSLNVDEIF